MVAIGDRKDIKMSVIKVNSENFEAIKNQKKPVLLDFYADWCGPCRMISPLVEEIAEERGDIVVGKVNVDENGELAMAFKVQYIPYIVAIKDGKIIHQSSGVKTKEQLIDMFK